MDKLPGSSAQVTVEKILPLASMESGTYTLTVKAVDKNRNNEAITQSAAFTIK